MRYKLLGNSGLRVSELCLGTMTFGEDWGWGASPEESRKVYDTFLEAGGNFIDTANVYTNGTSERLLGEFMHGQRERIVLATKYTNAAPGTDPNAAGNHRKSIGARKLARVKDNLACVDIRLEPALLQRLDAVSRSEMGFPHDIFTSEMARSLSFGGMWDRIDAR
jgi:aryl-alcohol dehydrogenase-like predicted oxidoreductase